MFKHRLAALVLASSLATSLAACGDRAPHIIQLAPDKTDADRDRDRPGQMAVNGQATLEVSPDCADISITLSAEHIKTGTAMKQLEATKATLIAALKRAGVETADVKLSSMNLSPVYELTSQGWQTNKVKSYRAELLVTATTKDFSKIGDIMDAAGSAGATHMTSAFRRSDIAQLKKQVRDMALAAAKDKAEQTAKALGIKLGRVLSVSENPGGIMWAHTYFPSTPNAAETRDSAIPLGGALQPLTLDVSISYELARET